MLVEPHLNTHALNWRSHAFSVMDATQVCSSSELALAMSRMQTATGPQLTVQMDGRLEYLELIRVLEVSRSLNLRFGDAANSFH